MCYTLPEPFQELGSSIPTVEQAELDKAAESTDLCARAGVLFIPAGVDTFGAYGTQARLFLGKLFQHYAKRMSCEGFDRFPGQHQSECWQRVSIALRKGVGAQLSSAVLVKQALPFPPTPVHTVDGPGPI